MTLDEVKDLLTPASVWLRRDGAQVKALFLTNQTLTKAQQEKYPPQVVYADADGNVLSRDLTSFASLYTFLNVDPDLEKRLANLIVFKATDFLTVDDPEDDEEVSLTEETKPDEEEKPVAKEKPAVQVREKAKPSDADDLQKSADLVSASARALHVDFKLSANEGYSNPKLSAKELSAACKIYTRQPDEHYKMMVHRLSFELSDTITIDALKEAFHPSNTVNTVDVFRVRTQHDKEVFVWDSWIGVFPEYSISSLYATVYVGTSDLSPVDTEETPGTETVNVSAEAHDPQQMGITTLPKIDGSIAEMLGAKPVAAPGLIQNDLPADPMPIDPIPTHVLPIDPIPTHVLPIPMTSLDGTGAVAQTDAAIVPSPPVEAAVTTTLTATLESAAVSPVVQVQVQPQVQIVNPA
jgi:hypothetical protein